MKEIFSKEPQEFNNKLAEALKKIPEFQVPEWAFYVKSGVSRKRVPEDEDFWYKRTASILRQLYLNGVVGVEKLRTRYGSRKNRGAKPARFKKSSGKIIRVILQQAEAAGLVEKITGSQFGRRLTQKGRDFLDSIETSKTEEKDLKSFVVEKKEFKQPIDEEEFDEQENIEEVNQEVEEEN